MYLSKINVKNYKSFSESGELNFLPGINIIIGPNNVGKTALLEAIELRFDNKPHKSKQVRPFRSSPDNKELSDITAIISVGGKELRKICDTPQYEKILLPEPPDNGEFIEKVQLFNQCFDTGLHMQASFREGRLRKSTLKHGLYEETNKIALLERKQNGFYELLTREPPRGEDTIGLQFVERFSSNIYRFYPERTKLGWCAFGSKMTLMPDASNLAEVLMATLTRNPQLYDEYVTYVTDVLPSVKWITSIQIEQADTVIPRVHQIRVWPVEKASKRDDLTIPLSECGSGIGQVLAILYVVVTSEEPRTIIIDEPQSFLHPGAAKKLIQVLHKFPQHQYFISTHSPEILSAAKPSTITGLQYIDGETKAKSISLEQTSDLREVLDEIGVKLSDVFFADKILWVEGPTEAAAFPLLLGSEATGVTMLPLEATGDLKRKKHGKDNARLVFKIYKSLSAAHALTPPVIAIILDEEGESLKNRAKLEEISEGLVKFIPRRMYENYLLDAEAIACVFNRELPEDKEKIAAQDVEKLLKKKQEDGLKDVHGANLLDTIFSRLSEKTVEYRKTKHSVALTKWLVENKPEHFDELREFLKGVLQRNE